MRDRRRKLFVTIMFGDVTYIRKIFIPYSKMAIYAKFETPTRPIESYRKRYKKVNKIFDRLNQ